MNRPSGKDIEEKIRKIRTAAGHEGGWRHVEHRLRDINERDRRGGNAVADGYPAGTLGGGSGPSVKVIDDDGQEVRVPVTSVEAAAIARMDDSARRDLLHRHLERTLSWLDEGARCVGAAMNGLDAIEHLLGAPVVEVHCESCARASGVEDEGDVLRFGSVGGVLERSMHLCSSCYRFVDRNRRLPSVEELERYKASGKWRLRAS